MIQKFLVDWLSLNLDQKWLKILWRTKFVLFRCSYARNKESILVIIINNK